MVHVPHLLSEDQRANDKKKGNAELKNDEPLTQAFSTAATGGGFRCVASEAYNRVIRRKHPGRKETGQQGGENRHGGEETPGGVAYATKMNTFGKVVTTCAPNRVQEHDRAE